MYIKHTYSIYQLETPSNSSVYKVLNRFYQFLTIKIWEAAVLPLAKELYLKRKTPS